MAPFLCFFKTVLAALALCSLYFVDLLSKFAFLSKNSFGIFDWSSIKLLVKQWWIELPLRFYISFFSPILFLGVFFSLKFWIAFFH